MRPLPGCFVSFDKDFKPLSIRVCEINIRPGEPEFQPIVKRLRNLGALMEAMAAGNLGAVTPEVRRDQISLCLPWSPAPVGPRAEGLPWSLTKGEVLEIDFDYFEKKKITVIPSAMDWVEGVFKSDGSAWPTWWPTPRSRPARKGTRRWRSCARKLLAAFDNGKLRVIPGKNDQGNRLALRRDIGLHFQKAELLAG